MSEGRPCAWDGYEGMTTTTGSERKMSMKCGYVCMKIGEWASAVGNGFDR